MNEPFQQIPVRLLDYLDEKKVNELTFRLFRHFQKRSSITKLKDENGKKYFIYSKIEIAATLGIKPSHEISKAIKTLENEGFIRTVRIKGKPTKYYID